jgi:hypothetical protein
LFFLIFPHRKCEKLGKRSCASRAFSCRRQRHLKNYFFLHHAYSIELCVGKEFEVIHDKKPGPSFSFFRFAFSQERAGQDKKRLGYLSFPF